MATPSKALKTESGTALETMASPSVVAVERKPLAATRPDAADEYLYLIGRPKLKQFLRFVHDNAVDPPDEDTLINEWQAAKDHIDLLEKEEAGAANDPVVSTIEVNSKYRPLLVEFLKDPLVQGGFNTVPTEVAFVELDRLVVYQKHIDLTYVRQLQRRLGPAPGDEDVFRACLPYDHPCPPAKWSRLDDTSYVFVSPSNDLRFLGTMPLKPQHIEDYPPPGALVGVVGLAVGFGSNFLNAVHCEHRLILNNGSHRAYALREMGFTHAPCVVQHVATRDELEVVASSKVRSDPDLFLRHPRPPMLRDYFNPKLRKVMPAYRQLRQLKVRFSVSEYFVPAL
jgi:hypothetical protein